MTVADHPTHPPDPLPSQRVRSFPESAMIRHATLAALLILIRRAARVRSDAWPLWQLAVTVMVLTVRSSGAAQRTSERGRWRDGGGT